MNPKYDELESKILISGLAEEPIAIVKSSHYDKSGLNIVQPGSITEVRGYVTSDQALDQHLADIYHGITDPLDVGPDTSELKSM